MTEPVTFSAEQLRWLSNELWEIAGNSFERESLEALSVALGRIADGVQSRTPEIIIEHAPSCPVSRPDFVPDIDPAVSHCNCDFGKRLAAELGTPNSNLSRIRSRARSKIPMTEAEIDKLIGDAVAALRAFIKLQGMAGPETFEREHREMIHATMTEIVRRTGLSWDAVGIALLSKAMKPPIKSR